MQTRMLDHLREAYGFDAWQTARRLDGNLFVWRFRLAGGEVEGWRAHRIQYVELEDGPPASVSMWLPVDDRPDTLLSLDVFECESADAAKGQLLRLLGEFEGPRLERGGADEPGDVSFVIPGRVLLFARANLAVMIRSAGPPSLPLRDLGEQVDRHITLMPASDERQPGAPEIVRFAVEPGPRVAQRGVPLAVEAADRRGRDVWFKFFSRTGEVRVEDGRPAFFPPDDAEHEVTLVAIGVDGAVGQRTLRVGGR